MNGKLLLLTAMGCVGLSMTALADNAPAAAYLPWKAVGRAIPEPLGGLKGDAVNGRKVAIDRSRGNCLACHKLPVAEEEFHGELGPSLVKVGKKLTEEKLRYRVVNIQNMNADSVMPPFYKNPDELSRVVEKYRGRTILTAQEVEDVVAYLSTLK